MRNSLLILVTCILQQISLNLGTILVVRPIPECITVDQFNKAAGILCENRKNTTLWQQLVDCHVPMSEEYLRKSSAAICPVPRLVDPTDSSKCITEVFLNFCTLGAGPNFLDRFLGEYCYVYGGKIGDVSVLGHSRQVHLSKQKYGDDITCNVGKCILNMGLNL
ncbi:uncharacterized protein LOC119067529 [Bradysia coprophila]|uniref:uncharacterized protein LOC119067529 n=1 Tax=Bradysia coprophila TaxID=38358 RepID=UPI00187DC248|nr:uncharacterized protein LOC119067529 [Bradysia coprophila]